MNKSSSSPVLEALESRLAPAGIVMLDVSGGVLTVTGDGDANNIQITETGPGTWNVSDGGGSGTLFSLNGGAALTSVDFAAANKINATLGSGDDTLSLAGTGVSGAVKVDGGDGADTFNTTDVNIGGNLVVNLGAGNDTVNVSNDLTVGGALKVDLGDGDNNFNGFANDISLASLSIKGGSGVDSVSLDGHSVAIAGDVTVHTGDGLYNDISLGAENDLTIGGDVVFRGGTGNDGLNLSGQVSAQVGGAVRFIGGGNEDSFAFRGETASLGSLNVRMDAGHVRLGSEYYSDDSITVNDSVLIRLGTAGQNGVEIHNTQIVNDLKVVNTSDIGLDVSIENSSVHGGTRINSDTQGYTNVRIVGSTFDDQVTIRTGAGDDSVTLYAAQHGDNIWTVNEFNGGLKVRLGDGNDHFQSGFSATEPGSDFSSLILNGGNGYDTAEFLTGYGNTFGSTPVVTHFESVA